MGNFNNLIQFNEHWFDDVMLPDGIDSEILKQAMILKCGLLIPLYPEPEFFQKVLGFWFTEHSLNIERLINLYSIEYNPLHNYDRYEKIKREHDDTETLTHGHVITDVENGNEKTERKTSAMNVSSYSPDTEETRTPNITDTTTNSGKDVTGNVGNSGEDNHIFGNIGVMTSQQMFLDEQNLLKEHNLYDTIVDMVASDLFLGVW